jgi:hypothetical protein
MCYNGGMPDRPEEHLANTQIATDRRRPRRAETDNPHLISLLRDPASAAPTPADEAADQLAPAVCCDVEDNNSLAPAEGIAVGLLVGLAMWGVIGAVAWYLL